jgi:hypothetical protein
MKRVWLSCSAVLFVLVLARAGVAQEETFTLGFDDSGGTIRGNAGDPASGQCVATLSHDCAEGTSPAAAQGWSLSLTADGATITSIGIAGTDAEAAFSGGFEKSELTPVEPEAKPSVGECEGKNGAVSAVVLSFTLPITIAPCGSTASIAVIGVEAMIPAGGGTATLSYVNGCRGSGQAVNNTVTQEGGSVTPVRETKTIDLVEVVRFCDDELNVGFSQSIIVNGAPFEGISGVGDPANPEELCAASDGRLEYEGNPGEVTAGASYVNIIQQIAEGNQVQGWSLSIALNSESLTLTNATTEGTPGRTLQNGGFEKTEVVDPDRNNGQQGAVSAVVLSFTLPITLPNGTNTVLCLTSEGTTPEEHDGGGTSHEAAGSYGFQNGLRGSGQPVNNVLTVGGGSGSAANFGTALGNIFLVPITLRDFIRGNANDDNKVNIADPIWIINELFRGGPASVCPDAADANDDGQEDLADATYLIDYLFRGQAAPSAPFPACGTDPSDAGGGVGDGLGCGGSSQCP